jgi:hypothetical protein
MASIHRGYMGYATIGETNVRFSDANITARQDVNIPDMVMGHWDRAAYNYQKVEVGGTISGPVTETFAAGAGSIWNWAAVRDNCGAITAKDVVLNYFCDAGGTNGSRTFTGMLANSVNFSCSAGDIAQFSIETMGVTAGAFGAPVSGPGITVTEKLLTWEQVGVTIASGGVIVPTGALLSAFDFTIANNCEAFYALGGNLFPTEVVPGPRTITGSISAYDPQAFNGVDSYDDYQADGGRSTITFDLGGTVVSFKVMFHRSEPTLNSGAIISTIAFTGTGVQSF